VGNQRIPIFNFYFCRKELAQRYQAAKSERRKLIINTVNGKPYTEVTEKIGSGKLVHRGELKGLKIIKRFPKT
jgi:hypothetical protein